MDIYSNNNYIMECRKYNNALACRRYYEKNKGNPEFRLRKPYQARKIYYKKRYPIFWSIFKLGNNYFLKTTLPVEIRPLVGIAHHNGVVAWEKQVNNFIIRRNRLLLKKVIDIWKLFEKTPRISKPIICSFF